MRLTLLLLIGLFSSQLVAEEIDFSKAVNVTIHKQGIFHHLDASGRKSIAANQHGVAVVWEDNRDGKPQTYVAFKDYKEKSFGKTIQLSNTQSEAYEPTVIAISKQHFLFAWEQNQQVWLSSGNAREISKPVLIDKNDSSQVSLSIAPDNRIFACWIQHSKPHRQVVVSEITITGRQTVIGKPVIAI